MDVVILNAPLVQLNSPYPSGAYLCSFFKSQGCNAKWYDLSIELFYSIFSHEGLTKLFDLSEKSALKMAANAEMNGDDATAYNLRRYVSTRESWITWIDYITGILSSKPTFSGREKEHQFLFSPYAPRGNRMESFLENLDHTPTVDDVRFLCSFALADLSDYITAAFDHNFSLVRYAEALTVDETSFSQLENQIDSPILIHFFKPVLEKLLNGPEFPYSVHTSAEKTMFCLSVPFAGTFTPALFAAKYIKKLFGEKAFVVIGGGFINTELREVDDPAFAKYIDAISYDRGYGSYYQLLKTGLKPSEPIYKLRVFTKGKILSPLGMTNELIKSQNQTEIAEYENKITATLVPDFSDVDYSRYPRVCDDKNPMHRLWSDGAWIKAYMAHGCYWHKCAFCDTQLDYVCGYHQTDVENLYNGLLKTCREKGIYGIHFVDEALPPSGLTKFGLMNAKNGNPLYYWGNIRFEKTFSYDSAGFLSYSGFGGVSAGLEVATGKGLAAINKGTDIESIVSACAAFKENGILVHAYMIYGFWHDTPQSIIDSMETLRQLFAAGLLDSAFWHKFVLTKNSQVYSEWEQGKHPELKPIIPKKHGMFAKNNLYFEGEKNYEKFGAGLETALEAWMHGDKLDMNVRKWFSFDVPQPSIPKNFIEKAIDKYEQRKEKELKRPLADCKLENLYWIGSKPIAFGNEIRWFYLQQEMGQKTESHDNHKNGKNNHNLSSISDSYEEKLSLLLWNLRPEADLVDRSDAIGQIKADKHILQSLQKFRGDGLCLL